MSKFIEALLNSATSSGSDANCIGFIRRDIQTELTPLLTELADWPEVAAGIRGIINTDDLAKAIFSASQQGTKEMRVGRISIMLISFITHPLSLLKTATFPKVPHIYHKLRSLCEYDNVVFSER